MPQPHPLNRTIISQSAFFSFQPSAFRLSGFFLALASLQAFSLFAATGPSLDVFPHNNTTSEIATFKQGARLFSNRDYTLAETPAALNGLNFLRIPIDGAEIRCTAPGEILVLTPTRGANSLESTLRLLGFTKDASIGGFQLFGASKNDRVLLHRKTLKAGDTLKLGRWAIVLGFAKADFKRVEFDTSEAGLAAALANRVWQGIPGIERTPKGRLFFTWFTGGEREPRPENMVLLCHSDDGGKTHSPPQIMAPPLKDGTRSYDPVPWIDPKGRLWNIYNRSNTTTGLHRTFARICENPDAPLPVFGPQVQLDFGMPASICLNKPTVLSSGEWLLPVSFKREPFHNVHIFVRNATPPEFHGVAISRDEGKTWKLHGAVSAPSIACETMIVELKDGRLWMLIRNTSGYLWESFSTDKGITWSEGKSGTIAGPVTRFFIRRLSSGNLLLVYHYGFDRNASGAGIRSHLTAQISTDDGKTWGKGLLLDERKGVSYPDGVQGKDGVIWVVYDRDRRGDGDILMAKFREEDVIAGKNVSGAVVLKHVVNRLQGKTQPGALQAPAGPTGDFNLTWHGDLKKLDDIPPVPGAEYTTLYKADGTAPENMGAYSHHPHVRHHAGRLYAIWSNHLQDEDHPGQRVLIRQSADFGKTWQPALTERPDILFPSLGDWKKDGEPRPTNINRAGIANGFAVIRGQLYAINEVERDGPKQAGDGRLVRRINDDGTFGDIFWLEPEAPQSPPGYPQYPGMSDPKYAKIGAEIREFLADKTRKNLPTWDLKGKRNTTTELDGGLPGAPGDGHSLCEPSKSFVTPDNILVNVWRDLRGPEVNNKRTPPSYMLYQSASRDGGENWSIPERTTIPNRNALPCAGNLPDGTVYLLNNPASRKHLILSLSKDGRVFDRSWLIRRVDESRRFAGKYKGNYAAAYQQAWAEGEWLFAIYSINKEDVEIARIPLKTLK